MAQRTITSYFGKFAEKENVSGSQESRLCATTRFLYPAKPDLVHQRQSLRVLTKLLFNPIHLSSVTEAQKRNSTNGKRKREDRATKKDSPGTPPTKKLEIDSPKTNAEEAVNQKSKQSPGQKETIKTPPEASSKSREEPKEDVDKKSSSEEERPRKKIKAPGKKKIFLVSQDSSDDEDASLPTKDESEEQVDNSNKHNGEKNLLGTDGSTTDEHEEQKDAFYKPLDSKKKGAKKSTASYVPNSPNYHPIKDASWKHRDRVPYAALASVFTAIEGTSARLSIITILSNYFRSVIILSPSDLLPSIYLCLNQLAPANEGIQLGIAETTLAKVIAQCTGRRLSDIQGDLLHFGDLGLVAECSKAVQRTMFPPPPLTVANVYARLKDIARMSGNAALSKKTDIIQTLYVACQCDEAKYLFRSLSGKLRIGLAEQSVLQALALACAMTPPNQKYPPEVVDASKDMTKPNFMATRENVTNILKTTYCQCPNYDKIIDVLLKDGVDVLPEKCKITPGTPLKPMLAHPTKGVQEVLTRFEDMKFTCEWKYDGERAQIHISESGDVSIYSRNQENTTSKYPDVIGRLKDTKKESVKSCILDCEAVAWDNETKQMRPFQILSTRKRKDANEAQIKVQVCIIMFDLLYLNGEPLVTMPFIKRRELLRENFKEVDGTWKFATSMDTTTMEEVQDFLEESVKGSCEGLMVKTLEKEATYEIAKRSRNWLKLKKDYLEGVGDTLDLVVIGGYLGKGKRTGTYGGFLLACYDQQNEEYQTLCKIGTGFSEEDLQKHTEFFKEHKAPQPKPYYRYSSVHEPDHWFEPVQVWEVKCADLSLSPVHKAAVGIVDSEKGISLRFPRFIRIRDDKNCEDATSAQQVAELYNNQEQIKSEPSTNKKVSEEDFY